MRSGCVSPSPFRCIVPHSRHTFLPLCPLPLSVRAHHTRQSVPSYSLVLTRRPTQMDREWLCARLELLQRDVRRATGLAEEWQAAHRSLSVSLSPLALHSYWCAQTLASVPPV